MHAPSQEARHRAKLRLGIGICTYEAIALAVDDPSKVPPITHLAHSFWPLAAACSTWTLVHLLHPWARTVHARVRAS